MKRDLRTGVKVETCQKCGKSKTVCLKCGKVRKQARAATPRTATVAPSALQELKAQVARQGAAYERDPYRNPPSGYDIAIMRMKNASSAHKDAAVASVAEQSRAAKKDVYRNPPNGYDLALAKAVAA